MAISATKLRQATEQGGLKYEIQLIPDASVLMDPQRGGNEK